MPGVARAGVDIAGSVIVKGSNNVFTNSAQTARIGDPVTGHGKAPHSGPVMAQGSPNVFANNIPVCRAGDIATCGHPTSGSPNVFANG
jgi:uncharacterized Zn-binding protein involved in type VI secretion